MTTPKRLSPEVLDSLLRNIGDEAPGIEERLREHIAAQEAGLTTVSCAFCPWTASGAWARDERVALLREHVKGCAEHPMRALEADVEHGQAVNLADLRRHHQHISELEKSLGNARKERDDLRSRLDGKQTLQAAQRDSALREVATLKVQRDDAVADNAALVRVLCMHADAKTGCTECGMIGHHFLECVTGRVSREARPGAALLEEHRKALARARNEGLEKAAAHCESEADKRTAVAKELATRPPTPQVRHGHAIAEEAATALAVAADDIRAMKEPESGETCADAACTKCRSGEPCR